MIFVFVYFKVGPNLKYNVFKSIKVNLSKIKKVKKGREKSWPQTRKDVDVTLRFKVIYFLENKIL